MKSYKEVFEEGKKHLLGKKIEDWEIDAWYLFSHVFDMTRAQYFMDYDKLSSQSQYRQYIDLIKTRANHVPLQEILGYTEFMGLKIKVNEHVLIPRQETEILVEEALKLCEGKDVLDLCTGSGCIIISLMKHGNINRGMGTDISTEALKVARENAKINQVDIKFLQSDLFDNIEDKFDIVVSNPPYIPRDDIENLSKEVKDHDPLLALDGKEDGLYFYKMIAKDIKKYIRSNGYLLFEIGYNQADDVVSILKTEGISNIKVIKDLTGFDRVIIARI